GAEQDELSLHYIEHQQGPAVYLYKRQAEKQRKAHIAQHHPVTVQLPFRLLRVDPVAFSLLINSGYTIPERVCLCFHDHYSIVPCGSLASGGLVPCRVLIKLVSCAICLGEKSSFQAFIPFSG